MRRDWIAMVLAIGLALALNLIVAAILYDAIAHPSDAGISENATQILTGWGGGIIGVLGAVFGYRAGAEASRVQLMADPLPEDSDPGPWPDETDH